jgi:hypothetical protein
MQWCTARERQLNDLAPTLILDSTADNVPLFHVGNKIIDIVAQEIQFMMWHFAVGLMDRGFGRRQSKDYITAARFDRCQVEYIPKKRIVGFRIGARYDDMSSNYHFPSS